MKILFFPFVNSSYFYNRNKFFLILLDSTHLNLKPYILVQRYYFHILALKIKEWFKLNIIILNNWIKA